MKGETPFLLDGIGDTAFLLDIIGGSTFLFDAIEGTNFLIEARLFYLFGNIDWISSSSWSE